MGLTKASTLGITNYRRGLSNSTLTPRSIIQTGLVLHLNAAEASSYPGSGSTWYDLSSVPTHATLYGSYSYSFPHMRFAGTSGAYAQVPSTSKFAFGTGDFTWELWINTENRTSYPHYLAFPDQATNSLKADFAANSRIYYYNSSWTTYDTINWAVNDNAWYHVVFKRQASVGYAYLNGSLIGSRSGFTTNFSAQALNIHSGSPAEWSPV